ncbi:MAG: hypothetical protein AAGF11_54440 [Myxococcota bacterium]
MGPPKLFWHNLPCEIVDAAQQCQTRLYWLHKELERVKTYRDTTTLAGGIVSTIAGVASVAAGASTPSIAPENQDSVRGAAIATAAVAAVGSVVVLLHKVSDSPEDVTVLYNGTLEHWAAAHEIVSMCRPYLHDQNNTAYSFAMSQFSLCTSSPNPGVVRKDFTECGEDLPTTDPHVYECAHEGVDGGEPASKTVQRDRQRQRRAKRGG